MPTVAQVIGGSGSSPGSISQVVAATITQDGTLLMLEFGNNRVQAFDLGSNPVRNFANAVPPYFLPLAEMLTEAGWRHLDIQADFSGLLYVLSLCRGPGQPRYRGRSRSPSKSSRIDHGRAPGCAAA